jgi:radical SAM protein with 4Fe4S-binding SPASM domain
VGFQTFVIELTESCNNNCLYCYNPWRIPESKYPIGTLSTEAIKKIIDKLQSETAVKSIGLSGGEPFLRSDIGDIVKYIRKKGIHPVIITNGTLLTRENVQATSDASSYEITLLSHNKKVLNHLVRREAFDDVIMGITNVIENGGNFVAAFVATKLNSPDLYRTMELAIALGAVGIMYNRINLSANNIRYSDQLLPTNAMIQKNLEELETINEKYNIPIASSVPIPPCLIDISKYKRIKFGFCPRGGEESYYTIDPSGNLKTCNHSPVLLGNIQPEKFTDIIKHPYVQKFRDTLPEECESCSLELKMRCYGGCRAASEACYGSLKEVDPMVKLSKN